MDSKTAVLKMVAIDTASTARPVRVQTTDLTRFTLAGLSSMGGATGKSSSLFCT